MKYLLCGCQYFWNQFSCSVFRMSANNSVFWKWCGIVAGPNACTFSSNPKCLHKKHLEVLWHSSAGSCLQGDSWRNIRWTEQSHQRKAFVPTSDVMLCTWSAYRLTNSSPHDNTSSHISENMLSEPPATKPGQKCRLEMVKGFLQGVTSHLTEQAWFSFWESLPRESTKRNYENIKPLKGKSQEETLLHKESTSKMH